MATQMQRTPIQIVPHFSRLQEWIASDEGFFQAEGLEPEMLPACILKDRTAGLLFWVVVKKRMISRSGRVSRC